jgi:hypothetical protein
MQPDVTMSFTTFGIMLDVTEKYLSIRGRGIVDPVGLSLVELLRICCNAVPT